MIKKILFVCTGNTCRSAMAVYLAAAIKEKEYPESGFCFDSAGIATADGYPASEYSVAVLAERDIDMSDHRSKKFQSYMVPAADLIVAMTEMHKAALQREYPEAVEKIVTLGEVSGSSREIPDPYLGSEALYRRTAEVLYDEISAMLKQLTQSRK